MNIYNNKITRRWNKLIRDFFVVPKLRRRLANRDFTLISNNCTAGFIYHDLGLQFTSPTINMFFCLDTYFDFMEHFDEYLTEELRLCTNPRVTPSHNYPVMEVGGGNSLPIIELHFMHYTTVECAVESWEKRKRRINRNNIFVIFTFLDDVDPVLLKRFDNLPFKNKKAFVCAKDCNSESAQYIPGNKNNGLGLISEYVNLWGKRRYDHFDFVKWFNKN